MESGIHVYLGKNLTHTSQSSQSRSVPYDGMPVPPFVEIEGVESYFEGVCPRLYLERTQQKEEMQSGCLQSRSPINQDQEEKAISNL